MIMMIIVIVKGIINDKNKGDGEMKTIIIVE
jgi:hypothetical protein